MQIFTDEPEYRFAPGAVLYTKDGEEEYVVESSRTFKNRWIIKFEGIDDRDASEAANGVVLYGEADDPEEMLEADEWYPKDLISLEARLAEGNTLGLGARHCGRQGGGCDRSGPVAAQDPSGQSRQGTPMAWWSRTARSCRSWTSLCRTSTSRADI